MAVRQSSKPQRRRSRDRNLLGMILICATTVVVALLLTKRSEVQVQAAQGGTNVVAEFDTVSVPVPIAYVPAGTKISSIEFRQVAYPKHQLPVGALISIDDYLDATTIAPLPANLPIFPYNLSTEVSASNPVVDSIPAGMRAITVQVDATSAVEGWAGSGSIVDVLLVEDKKTSVIAEKVKILSAERSVVPVSNSVSPNVPRTVTLLVTQDQCLAINTAIPLGRIAFALRGVADSERWIDPTYSPDELRGRSRVIKTDQTAVNGYISVKNGNSERRYALSDGKWIPTEIVPDGFMISERNSSFKEDLHEAARSKTN